MHCFFVLNTKVGKKPHLQQTYTFKVNFHEKGSSLSFHGYNQKCLMLHFSVQVWTPSGQGLIKYSMQSHSLEFLDISQCRGFYLQALLMPALRRIRVVRRPWNGPLVLSEVQNLPCLHGLLAEGTPNLRKLNEHYLQENWRWQSYPALEDALRDVCACSKHKTSWGV